MFIKMTSETKSEGQAVAAAAPGPAFGLIDGRDRWAQISFRVTCKTRHSFAVSCPAARLEDAWDEGMMGGRRVRGSLWPDR